MLITEEFSNKESMESSEEFSSKRSTQRPDYHLVAFTHLASASGNHSPFKLHS